MNAQQGGCELQAPTHLRESRPSADRLIARKLPVGGFTMIEVIVTLVIMSIMTALAIPAFLRDPVLTDMDDAQGRLEALFRMARDSAVRSALPVTVAFDSATGYAWLDVPLPAAADPSPGGSLATASNGGITLRAGGTFGGGSTLDRSMAGSRNGYASQGESLGLPSGISLQTFRARALFTFSPNGTVQSDSLIVRGPNGEMRHLTLEPWTGRVQAR